MSSLEETPGPVSDKGDVQKVLLGGGGLIKEGHKERQTMHGAVNVSGYWKDSGTSQWISSPWLTVYP